MVYHGIPSKGCENCRQVEITAPYQTDTNHMKCDEKHPQCSRCLTLGRICSGYREQSSLLFRDETSKTKDKIRQRKRLQDERETKWRKNTDLSVIETPFIKYGAPHPPLLPSKEEMAICHFYHSTVENLSTQDPALYLHEELPRLQAASRQGSALHLALEAVALVASAEIIPHAAQLGLNRYVKAVKALREAMKTEGLSSDYQSLYGVLLLCGYETITGHVSMPSAWGTHVDGALALLKLRATHGSPFSRSMHFFIQKNVVMSQMQICQPVDELFTQGLPSPGQDPEIRLLSIAAGIPRVQHQSIDLAQLETTDIERIVHDADTLDSCLSTWAQGLPPGWSYATAFNINNDARSDYAPRSVHKYAHFYTARVWNFYRVSQLILLSIRLRASSILPSSSDTTKVQMSKESGMYKLESSLSYGPYLSLVAPQKYPNSKRIGYANSCNILLKTVFLLLKQSAMRRARYSMVGLKYFALTACETSAGTSRNGRSQKF
ncbi:hypothetical protein LB506_003836, partial [Fusarium annulatum]